MEAYLLTAIVVANLAVIIRLTLKVSHQKKAITHLVRWLQIVDKESMATKTQVDKWTVGLKKLGDGYTRAESLKWRL